MRIQVLHSVPRRIVPLPKFQAQISSMANKLQPKFSESEGEDRLMAETTALLENKWALDETQQGLEKTFNFPTYAKALDFILLIGVEIKLHNHHPDLRNTYKSVFYHWTTHRPRGLSSKDIQMARLCDEKADLLGHVTRSESEQQTPASAT